MATGLKLAVLLFIQIATTESLHAQRGYVRTEYVTVLPKSAYSVKGKKKTEKVSCQRYDARENMIEEGFFVNSIHGIGFSTNYGDTDKVNYRIFDDSNMLVEESTWQYFNNKKNHLLNKTTYEYDVSGKIHRYLTLHNPGESYTSSTFYYLPGKIITIDTAYNFQNGSVTENMQTKSDTTILDSLGRIIEELHYSSNHKLIYKYVHFYDKFGLGKTTLRYESSPLVLYSVTEWQYSRNKNLLSYSEIIIGQAHEQRERYSYDQTNRITLIETYLFNDMVEYTKYVYQRQ